MTHPRGCFHESEMMAVKPAAPTPTVRDGFAGPEAKRKIGARLLADSAMGNGAGKNGFRAMSAFASMIARSGWEKSQTNLWPRLSKVQPVSAAPDSSQKEAVTGSKENPVLPSWSGLGPEPVTILPPNSPDAA